MASQSLDTEPAFCCASVAPYKPRLLDHEACCSAFLDWVHDKDGVRISSGNSSSHAAAPKEFIVQLVRQVNYGKVLSKRYFRHTAAVSDLGSTGKHTFTEINEQDVLLEHFQKLNTFKKSVASQARPLAAALHQPRVLGLKTGAGVLTHATVGTPMFLCSPWWMPRLVCTALSSPVPLQLT
jgi:hypothetical protein